MKKSLLALAALGLAGAASAQSSVTIFGIVDTGLQRVNNSGGGSVTRLTNSGMSVPQLGFRGVEDLGGGLSASFWIEAAVNSDDGTGRVTSTNNQPGCAPAAPPCPVVANGAQGLTFNRRSTVSLAGGWGEVRLGRDYNPSYWNLALFSPFSTLGVGGTMMSASIVTGVTAGWTSNGIAYWLPPNLGGLYGQLQHWRGENASNSGVTEDDGTGTGFRIGYRTGPLDVALAIARTQRGGPLGDIRQDNAGASWDFGAVKVMGAIGRDHGSVGTVAADGKSWSIGAIIPLGTSDIRLASSQYTSELATGASPRSRKVAIGYRYYLSKRTALYTAYARVRNSGGAAAAVVAGAGAPGANRPSSGFDLGIRHSF
jgi:predicted porin